MNHYAELCKHPQKCFIIDIWYVLDFQSTRQLKGITLLSATKKYFYTFLLVILRWTGVYFAAGSTSLILFCICQSFCQWLALPDGDADCKQSLREFSFMHNMSKSCLHLTNCLLHRQTMTSF